MYYLNMAKHDKLIKRIMTKPNNFTYSELKKLLSGLGYTENKAGKTSGSRVAFINKCGHIIRLHKPHPGSELKKYQVNYLVDELRKRGFFDEE